MKKVKCFLFCSMMCIQLSAQRLGVSLPYHVGKEVMLVAVHGLRQDTICSVVLDQKGNGVLTYPAQKMACLATLRVKGVGALSYQLIISPHESPHLYCEGEYVYAPKAILSKSPENDAINRWYDALASNKKKAGLAQEMAKLYEPSDILYYTLNQESQRATTNILVLKDSLNHSVLFAAKFLQLSIAQEEVFAKVWAGKEERTKAKKYFASQIDFEALYGSSLWFNTINASIDIYTKEGAYYEQFGIDVVANMQKIKDIKIVLDLADAAILICEKFSWHKDQESIVNYLATSGRIKKAQGKLKKLFQMQEVAVGKIAPDFVLGQHIGKIEEHNDQTTVLKSNELSTNRSLVIFYQSGCGHCETTMIGLRDNYEDLRKKGIRIIGISADTDEQIFRNTTNYYPWKDNFCDLEGFKGINFNNYSVLGTPTLFIIDKNGKIEAKLTTIEEVLTFVKTN